MAFDPSVIGDIGNQPNVGATVGQAFQLKDMMNENTLNQYKLREAKQTEADTATTRKILSKYDVSNPQQASQAASKLQQAGLTGQGMEVLKANQSYQSGQFEQQLQQLQIGKQTTETIASILDPAVAEADEARLAGKSDAIVKGIIQKHIPQMLETVANSDLPQAVKDNIKKRFAQNPNVSFDELKAWEMQADNGRAAFAQRLGEFKAKSTEQHQKVAEQQGQERVQQGQERIDQQRTQGGRYGIREPQTSAGQQLRNDFMGLTGGKVTLAQLRSLDFDDLASQGKTGQQLVQAGLTYTGQTRAASAEGQRAGNVAILEGSVSGAGAQVLDALKGVSRGNIQAVNKALAAGKTEFGNAAESRYAATIQSLINEYSRVISGGTGQSTDSARREGMDMLNKAQSTEQVQAVIAQMNREVQIVQQAAERALSGQGGPQPTLGQPGGAAPGPAAAAANDPLGIR